MQSRLPWPLSLAPRSHIISGEVSKGPSASVKSSAAAHAESDIGLEETGELGAAGRSLVLQLQGSSQRFQQGFWSDHCVALAETLALWLEKDNATTY